MKLVNSLEQTLTLRCPPGNPMPGPSIHNSGDTRAWVGSLQQESIRLYLDHVVFEQRTLPVDHLARLELRDEQKFRPDHFGPIGTPPESKLGVVQGLLGTDGIIGAPSISQRFSETPATDDQRARRFDSSLYGQPGSPAFRIADAGHPDTTSHREAKRNEARCVGSGREMGFEGIQRLFEGEAKSFPGPFCPRPPSFEDLPTSMM